MKRFLLLIKRNFIKPGFLLFIILVAATAFLLAAGMENQSGMMRVALVDEDGSDISKRVINDFMTLDTVIDFSLHDKRAAALDALRNGEADSLWVIGTGFENAIKEYGRSGMLIEKPPVEIYSVEESVWDKLARIRAFSVIYPYISKESFAAEASKYTEDMSGLMSSYEKYKRTDELFLSNKISGGAASGADSSMRGVLAVFVLVSSLVGMIYFYADCENGVLGNISFAKRGRLSYCYVASTVIPVAVLVFLAECFMEAGIGFGKHLAAMLLLVISSVAFGNFFGRMLVNSSAVAVSVPFVFFVLLGLCPVYFNLRQLRVIQIFIPAYHYITFDGGARACLEFAFLAIIFFSLNVLLSFVRRKA